MASPSTFPRERITLTPVDRAFLDSEPDYERPSLPQPVCRPEPPASRRVGALLLFVGIAGLAVAILAAAAFRALALAIFH
jgi:hypothetical protein